MSISYLTDNKGNKIAVQVPYREWGELMDDYKRLRQYHTLKNELKESFLEVEEMKRGENDPASLFEFLNEC